GKFSSSSSETSTTSFVTGLGILFVAQVLSALMGLYTQSTYALYGPHWNENLFYSHFLSLPLFVPFLPSFLTQYRRLLAAPALEVPIAPRELFSPGPQRSILRMSNFVPASLTCSEKPVQSLLKIRIPIHLVSLLLNSLTQYACIRGVNLLGARTSALGVTIVLNVRKLISLFVSIYLFGNDLPLGVMLGAAVVFTGGGIYAWEGSRRQKKLIKAIRTV
ncbi:golgi uridine diphosphate-N- acetylglucosamine transporter, partial [Lambiella insularis]|nr:golgi uridine diphosphate-N- acetylglucosamine transporter [Lambiella insularis]